MYYAPPGSVGLSAPVLDMAGITVTNFLGPSSPGFCFAIKLTGMWNHIDGLLLVKPDPTANFPYGFNVDPDVPL